MLICSFDIDLPAGLDVDNHIGVHVALVKSVIAKGLSPILNRCQTLSILVKSKGKVPHLGTYPDNVAPARIYIVTTVAASAILRLSGSDSNGDCG